MLTSAQWILTKYLLTAGIVVLVSELAKRSDRLGALVSAFPLVTILTLLWLYAENQSQVKIANHAWYTFWYVLPTLPMFVMFPWLIAKFGFWWALGASAAVTMVSFGVTVVAIRPFGVDLI